MKIFKLIIYISIFLSTIVSFNYAYAANQVNITVYMIDKEGNTAMADGAYDVRFAIYSKDRKELDPYPSNSDAAFRIWQENQKVNIYDGVMSAYLGLINSFPGDLDFTANDYYLGIQIGTDSEMAPRKKMGVVPVAMNSINTSLFQSRTIGNQPGNVPIVTDNGSLDSNILSKIKRVGTISVGTWEGDPIESDFIADDLTGKTYNGLDIATSNNRIVLENGTNNSLILENGSLSLSQMGNAGSIVYSNGTSFAFSGVGSNGQILVSSGITAPTWMNPDDLGLGGGSGDTGIGNGITGGIPGSVLFVDGDGNMGQNNDSFYWDDANEQLIIGASPLYINSSGISNSANSIALDVATTLFVDNVENPTDYESENSGPTGTIDAQVSADTDDGLGYYNSGSWLFDTSIGLAGAGTLESLASIDRVGSGLRFAGVNIPEGVTITSAYLSFYAVNPWGLPQIGGSGTKSKITGELSTSASTFSSLSDYQTRRGTIVGGANNNNITTAQVGWDDATWTASSWNNSPDISSVIQEIADLGAVTNLALFFDDHDNLSTSGNYIYAANSYEAGVSTAPRLHIEYGSSDTNLVAYAESTIKTQGSYSLRGEATITDSLNKTLTRTLDVPLNLSNINTIYFDLRSNRTGSNIKIGLHDSGGTTTEITPDLTSANAFQNITWDISGVVNASKDAIDQIIITIVNADSANTFYLDNIYFPDTANQSIAFSINNSERMRIAASGNIGIGTDNPTSLLNIAGTLGVSGLATFSGTPTGSGIGQGSVYINPTESGEGAPVFQGWEAQTDWDMENIPSLDVVPALVDLDNDGDYDLLINIDGIIGAYENTGSATAPIWTAKPEWNVPTDFGSWGYPTVADLDNDGDYDLLVGNTANMAYGVENTGSATLPAWAAKPEWNTPAITNTNMNLPTLGDLDGDGDYDLMVGTYDNGSTLIILGYENTGTVFSPSWSAEPSWNIPMPANYAIYPILTDFDDDGDQDLFIGNWASATNSVYAFENTGDGSAPVWTNNPDWEIAAIGIINIPAFADLDDDGDKDMLLSTRTGIIRGYEQIKEVIPTTIFGVALDGSEMLRVSSDGITSILNAEVNNDLIVIGNAGIGTTDPTARLHLGAGTSVAGTAPLKFTSGTLLTDPEPGAMEFLGDNYYLTITSGIQYNQYESQYPPEHSDTYVKATSTARSNLVPYYATDPTKSLTDNEDYNSWRSSSATNQRFHIDLGSAKVINRIYYENTIEDYSIVNRDVRHFTFWGSNDASAFADLVYGNDANWTQISASADEFEQHVPEGVADPKYITVENYTAYRYYAFKFADNWGAGDAMGVRRIELQQGLDGTLTEDGGSRKGIVLNDGITLTAGRIPFATTNGRLTDAANFVFDGTNVGIGTSTPGYMLDVAGDINLTGDLYQNGSLFTESQWTTSGSNIYYNTGNVGIGTTSPSEMLSIGDGASYFNVTSQGDVYANLYALDGSSLANGTGTSATTLIVDDGTDFDIGNYVQVESTDCVAGVDICYAKITDKATNTLTISPAISWADDSPVTEIHIPEIGGTNLASTLSNRFGRGYFIDGIVTGNGTTYFTDKGITSAGDYSINGGQLFIERNTGNVGIGTTEPYSSLEIVQPQAYIQLTSTNTGGTGDAGIGIQSGGTGTASWIWQNVNESKLRFMVGDTDRLVIADTGNVGIGTTSPSQMLQIGTAANPGNLYIANGYICVDSDGTCGIGSPAAGTVYAVNAYTTGADYAEYFYTQDTDLKSGEAVCVDTSENKAIKRCENDGDNNIMGIVSSNPSIVGNRNQEQERDPDHYKIIGMMGQVAGLISTENGEIKVGDNLTASIFPGYMRRANAGESTVGIAMESFKGAKGTIQVLISRRNQSLTVEKVEEAVTENIKNMNVEDQVSNMIAEAEASLDLQIKNANQDLQNIQNNLIQTNADVSMIQALQVKIQQQMDEIAEITNTTSDFISALDVSKVLYKDVFGNLDLGEGKMEAVEITAGVFTIKVVDKEAATIGEAVICPEVLEVDENGKCTVKQIDEDGDNVDDKTGNPISNGRSIKVMTAAVNGNSKIFVTAKDVTDATLAVTDIDEGKGFTVKIKEKTSDDINFDWWIVEKK